MDVRTTQKVYSFIASASVAMGIVFYFLYRPHFSSAVSSNLPSLILGSFPSFIFIVMMTSLSVLLLGNSSRKSLLIPVIWFCILSLFEFLQRESGGFLYRGTFDVNDLYSAGIATIISVAALKFISPSWRAISRWGSVFSLGIFSVSTLLGSVITDPCDNDKIISKDCIVPVVLPWEELRQEVSIDVSGSQVLQRSGKVYKFDTWLLIVEKYRGIHIFDVTDKLNPLRRYYIPIAGALDLTIKGTTLYSSAFTDLVMIDLDKLLKSSGTELVMSREVDVFLHSHENQFYPDRYLIRGDQYGHGSKGIVIGYKTVSGKVVLYGDKYDLQANEKNRKKDNNIVKCILLVGLC